MKNDIDKSELKIAQLIRIVVIASAVVILFGLILYLTTGNSGYANDIYPTNPLLILSGVLTLKSYAIIMTGIFILILSPILRVGVSVIVFYKEKDFVFVGITALVFVILIISLILGKAE